MAQIQLEEVLQLKYLSGYSWSPDGRYIAYKWNDGGVTNAWLKEVDSKTSAIQLTEANSSVTGLEWNKDGLLALVLDGNVCVMDPLRRDSLLRLTCEGGYRPRLAWSPDGGKLAFSNGDMLSFYDLQARKRCDIKPLGEVFAGRFSQTVSADSFAWSPDGELFLYTFLDPQQKPYLALVTTEGQHIWRSAGHKEMIGEGKWIDAKRIVYRLSGRFRAAHDYYLLTIPPREQWVDYSEIGAISQFVPSVEHLLHVEEPQQRGSYYCNVQPHRAGNQLLLGLEEDGWLHYYLYDLSTKQKKQLTFGQCEDFGQAGDVPSWSPDGKCFVYASNRNQRIERQLWIYNLGEQSQKQITKLPVTNTSPKWSPDGKHIAFMHCDHAKNGDIWVYKLATQEIEQLTFSMPAGLETKMQKPALITYKGAQNWDIDGFLYKPADFDPHKKYPAIVWVHGGPMRQMRGSWHPSATYSHFYAFNQYLVSQGYIVLSPNFRGGIGYGAEFRYGLYGRKGVDDTIDIVSAGHYLKQLPYVDGERVAVYGLSYGGYMTLHSLTQYPDCFALGINIAGLWDIAQWGRWIRDTYGNYEGDAYFKGDIEEHPELWAAGSPVTYKHNLCKPLMNLQGTADPNVDFSQLDRIVKDCVALGVTHESIYYPDESHTFRWRRTWKDALPRMVRMFKRYLKEV